MSEQTDSKTLENLSTEERRFPPSEEIAAQAPSPPPTCTTRPRRPARVLGQAGP